MKQFFQRRQGSAKPAVRRTETTEAVMQQPYDIAIRNNRILTFTAGVLGVAALAMSFMLVGLFPLKTTNHVFVAFDDASKRVVHVQPMKQGLVNQAVVAEALARQYVENRESILLVNDQKRLNDVKAQSSASVWAPYLAAMDPRLATSPITVAKREKFTREINVLGTTHLPNSGKVISIEYEMLDTDAAGQVQRRHLRTATLQYDFARIEFEGDDKYRNPTGFRVVGFTTERRQNTPTPS